MLFSINASFAADLSTFSAFKQESEMLLGAGTLLNVLNVQRMSPNLTIVELGVDSVAKNLLGIVPPT